jgi:hypothetical protein
LQGHGRRRVPRKDHAAIVYDGRNAELTRPGAREGAPRGQATKECIRGRPIRRFRRPEHGVDLSPVGAGDRGGRSRPHGEHAAGEHAANNGKIAEHQSPPMRTVVLLQWERDERRLHLFLPRVASCRRAPGLPAPDRRVRVVARRILQPPREQAPLEVCQP